MSRPLSGHQYMLHRAVSAAGIIRSSRLMSGTRDRLGGHLSHDPHLFYSDTDEITSTWCVRSDHRSFYQVKRVSVGPLNIRRVSVGQRRLKLVMQTGASTEVDHVSGTQSIESIAYGTTC